MFPEPVYSQNIVVGVILRNSFAWYITEKEYWYLDYTKYDRALLATGYNNTTLGDYAHRFDIAVLNEDTAEGFLSRIVDRRVPANELSHMMVARREADKEDDLLDFAPSLLVNFDQRQLFSQYPEMIRFEIYVPDNWVGAYRDFTSEIPQNERYWIVNRHNLFE
jgi:hypothetical protein